MVQKCPTKFYGGIAKRVLIITPKESNAHIADSHYDFIKNKFNSVRNYREFKGAYPVKAWHKSSDNLPDVYSLLQGDVCLILGYGRFIDKDCYEYMKSCFEANVPVFFIRSSSLIYDDRADDNIIWKSNVLVENINGTKKFYQSSGCYFMEIPSIKDLIPIKSSDTLYALLPAMVPSM